MDLDAFRQQLVDLEPALEAWGSFVEKKVRDLAADAGVKVQLTSKRLKEIPSAVGKIARKGYKNPLTDMTDLVGVRIVVLLSPDVVRMRNAVEAHQGWNARLSRDPEFEKDLEPERFDYQSLHFEIRPKYELSVESVVVSTEVCCELQVRTLMQHTYAEVVHDTIYKRKWIAPSKARRYVASSAALIDTADHLFCETMNVLEQDSKERSEILDQLVAMHGMHFASAEQCDPKLNNTVLETYGDVLVDELVLEISSLLESKPYIVECISERLALDLFWSQPVVLLLYWLVSRFPRLVHDRWPFASSIEAVELIYSDLGMSP